MNPLRAVLHVLTGWVSPGLFWMREIAGWLLVVLGLWVFARAIELMYATPPHIIVAGPMTFIGTIIFRGGIHLLKVAAAAQICLRAQRQADAAVPARAAPSLLTTPFELGRREPPPARQPLGRG
jgi:hypothetical protein